MSYFFVDSSALVKRYLAEKGSAWVTTLLDPGSGHTVVVAAIGRVEVAAALAARQRAGDITLAERDRLVNLVLLHFDTEYQIVLLDDVCISNAVDLTQNHRLRGYDAVQLAAALATSAVLPAVTLITADRDLMLAAQAEGMAADDPKRMSSQAVLYS